MRILWPIKNLKGIKWLHALILFVAYIGVSQIAFYTYTPPAIFPLQSGVALAGLVLGGLELWVAVYLGALVSYLLGAPDQMAVAFTLAVANTAQAVLGAYLLKKFNFQPLMERMRDVFALMGVALVVSVFTPSVIFLLFYLQGASNLPITWGSYWAGHIFSLLIFAPFLIQWLSPRRGTFSRKEQIEALMAFIALISINLLLSFTFIERIGGVPVVYILLIPLFWISLRFGPRLATLAIALTCLITFLGISLGYAVEVPTTSLGLLMLNSQVFLEVIAVICFIMMAITEERRTAIRNYKLQVSRLEDALATISATDKAKEEFIAILAHELRNPFSPVVSHLELIKHAGASQTIRDSISIIEENIRHIGKLLEDILDVSRVTQRKFKLRIEQFMWQDTIKNGIEMSETHRKEKGIMLSVQIPQYPVYLKADPLRLQQVITNLINNAIKYSPSGSRVWLTSEITENEIVLRVKDEGTGIALNTLERIFDPFVQGTNSGPQASGIGIGLFLSKTFIELHGGTLRVISEGPNKGSEFVVSLPKTLLIDSPFDSFVTQLPPAPPKDLPGAATVRRQPLRILVVDDKLDAAEALGKLLTLNGHTVEVVYTGRDAIQKVSTFSPQLIFLDIRLPDLDGYTVAKTMRELGVRARIVALTGFGLMEDKQKAYEAGFDDHLTKPVPFMQLMEIVAKYQNA